MKKIYKASIFALVMGLLPTVAWAQNSLTAQEKKQGWKLLFDGKSMTGWRTFNSDKAGAGWKISNGELYLDKSTKEGRGDLVTHGEFQNYEFSIEWKIDACGNSGILFNVVEDSKYSDTYLTGPEMQVLDNSCNHEGNNVTHRAGDLYDLISCTTEPVKPAGEWNQVRIISNKGNTQFWMNSVKVVEFTMHTPRWDEMVAKSKFKTMPDFGDAMKGHIALQDHGDQVWFRNIKIKELK